MATFKDMEDNLKSFIMHTKINGGLGYEERLVLKWFGRYGIKDKLTELSNYAEKTKDEDSK